MKENERKIKMVVKGISRKIFRRIALESCPTVHLGGGPMTVSENYPTIHLRKIVITCALRWGVTRVGDYHYWALLTLSRDHYFRYRECSGRRRSLEADFQKKVGLWL